MRYTTILLTAALLAGTSAGASEFGLYGSYWDTDVLGTTAGFGIGAGFGDGPIRFDLRGSYFPDLSESFDDLTDFEGTGNYELEALVPEAGVSFNFLPGEVFRPYVGVGGSYYILDGSHFEVDNEVGYYGLAGFSAGGDSVAFFAEAIYRRVEATVTDDDLEDDFDLDNEVDLDLDGLSLNAGVRWRF